MASILFTPFFFMVLSVFVVMTKSQYPFEKATDNEINVDSDEGLYDSLQQSKIKINILETLCIAHILNILRILF